MYFDHNKAKQKEADTIAMQVEQFLKAGGEITECKKGRGGIDAHLDDNYRNKNKKESTA